MKRIESSITPQGFQYGIHKPSYDVTNLRQETELDILGLDEDDNPVDNTQNYPDTDLRVENADWIFEIPNPFPFRGRTFIDKEWADASARYPERISLQQPPTVSLNSVLKENGIDRTLLAKLPSPLLLALATTSTDKEDLIELAGISCEIITTSSGWPGLRYKKKSNGRIQPVIHDHQLFEAVANNPHLPDEYKIAMVIRPGAQGSSEIVGEWPSVNKSHVYEYLRRNSYISGGHYAANMADDAIRYNTGELKTEDMHGLRHLYYQRTYVRLATDLEIPIPGAKRTLTVEELESLRRQIQNGLKSGNTSPATLWGWNFGFDYAPSRYRLHASHQQIHQQYAVIPDEVDAYTHGTENSTGTLSAYSSGDLVADVISQYKTQYNSEFYDDYLHAIGTNKRMDDRTDLDSNLVVWSDDNAILFVPKAQTSQWELQLMTLPDESGALAGNIVECNTDHRKSLDTGILIAQKVLAALGAKMVTSIEYAKRLNEGISHRQPLIYALLPRLPESPGAFSEAHLRFINGHYPEDFAAACRKVLDTKF